MIWVSGTVAALTGLAVIVAFGVGLWAFASADHLGILDDPAVADTAAQACKDLRVYVAEHPLPADGSPAEIARAIRAQDRGIAALIASMTALGEKRLKGDHPAVYWVSDWRWLENLRELYAFELSTGQTPMASIPVVDGYPITHRMRTLVRCSVVNALAKPLRSPQPPEPPGQVVPARWSGGTAQGPRRAAGARSG